MNKIEKGFKKWLKEEAGEIPIESITKWKLKDGVWGLHNEGEKKIDKIELLLTKLKVKIEQLEQEIKFTKICIDIIKELEEND